MTNNEILKADLLDILFEHRNKSYGAYALRRYYNNRLMIALGIALSAVVLVFLMSLLKGNSRQPGSLMNDSDNAIRITQVDIEKTREHEQQPKKVERVAQKDFRNIRIVDNKDADKPIATHNDLIDPAISTIDAEGQTPDDPGKSIVDNVAPSSTGKADPTEKADFEPKEYPPSFPGGPEALASFFSRTLSSPTDLEAGEKKLILVRFVVGADGSITKAEIIQSGGDSYDREVLRAFKHMPRWNPAIQNGFKVATSFTQPVTFIGVEQ